MLKLIDTFDLWESLERNFKSKPVWGICAGTILLAEDVTNPKQKSFGVLPITVERNGYGRQLESHNYTIDDYEVSFIRAPVITAVNDNLDVLAEEDGKPVWVKNGKAMATTFHAELTLDSAVFSAASGDIEGFERPLSHAMDAGSAPVAVLRALANHLRRLHRVAVQVESGMAAAQAVQALRPPVFFKQREAFLGQLRRWSPARLEDAMRLVWDAEARCKRTGMPDGLLSRRAFLAVARLAATRSRG